MLRRGAYFFETFAQPSLRGSLWRVDSRLSSPLPVLLVPSEPPFRISFSVSDPTRRGRRVRVRPVRPGSAVECGAGSFESPPPPGTCGLPWIPPQKKVAVRVALVSSVAFLLSAVFPHQKGAFFAIYSPFSNFELFRGPSKKRVRTGGREP